MSEENKTIELKEEELSKASGGLEYDTQIECVNFNEYIRNSNANCCDKGKTKGQGAKYSCCYLCGHRAEAK